MEAEVKSVIDALGKTFEEFKAQHAKQVDELKKGFADPAREETIKKLSDRMTDLELKKADLEKKAADLQKRGDELEKKLNRPNLGDGDGDKDEAKNLRIFNFEMKAFAQEKGRAAPADITVEQYRQYKTAFDSAMRKDGRQLTDDEVKAMSVGTDAEGGFWVPADTSGGIVTKLFDLSPIRSIANVQVISSDRLEGIEDLDEAASGWVGETQTRSDTNTPRIGKYEIPAHEMYAQPKATQKLLDDAAVNVEAWLSGKVTDKFAREEGLAFVAGNGINKPRGFTTYTTAATADASRAWGTLEHVNTGVSSDFAASSPADILFDLEAAFKPGYLAGAGWVTKRQVIVKVRKFKGTDGNYLWQPGLQAGRPASLIGYPITLAEDMPALASGSLSLALGNFGMAYQIVDRLGIRVLRDPYTDKPYVKFYTTKRTGGAVVHFEALKFIRFGT